MISEAGGSAPRWRGDGKELVYLAPDGKLMAVEITPGAERRAATPAPLFQTPPGTLLGDMAADGKRFLLVTPVGERVGAVHGRAQLDGSAEAARAHALTSTRENG